MLSGVDQQVWEQLARTETFEMIPESDVFVADAVLGSATRRAVAAAREWQAQFSEQPTGAS